MHGHRNGTSGYRSSSAREYVARLITEKDEATVLINQLLEHRQLKRRGVCATTKAAQLDGFQMLLDLYECTGIRGLAIFSRGMEWVNYEVAIREARGIELAGLPPNIPLSRPGTWNVEKARRFRDRLCNGSIHWVAMTKAQHDELKAEHNQRRAEMGAGVSIKKSGGVGQGEAHTKKKNAGKHAEVQATGEVGSALPAGNATTDIVYPQLIKMPQNSEGLPTMLSDVPLLTMEELDEIELGMGTWFGP
ncbi:hypothetical protein K438DRAFT_2086847 [Mycena galopus ATCC 62051]|nr:hypothetical protein K438DRAFT_2086847 [Mycena galopus ATCC 62051]